MYQNQICFGYCHHINMYYIFIGIIGYSWCLYKLSVVGFWAYMYINRILVFVINIIVTRNAFCCLFIIPVRKNILFHL